jgi:glutathione S-transferase
MTTIQLFSAKACPYAHRTRLVLAEKRVPFALHEIDLQNKPANFLAVSAYGKVPAIEHDGVHLYESAIINEYLDEVFPEPRLLPGPAAARALARIWIDYANTRFVQAFGALLRAPDPDAERTAKAALNDSLAFFEREGLGKLSKGGPFFFGESVSLVDLTFPREFTRLAAWQDAVAALGSAKAQSSATEYYIERYSRFAKPAASA